MKKKTLIMSVALVTIVVVILAVTIILVKKNSDSDKEATNKMFVTVTTNCGRLQGKINKVKADDGKMVTIYTFKNIPYAEPPVKELRWRPPVPLNQNRSTCWSGTKKYSDDDVICKQASSNPQSIYWKKSKEDCLVLQVRTPVLSNNSSLPVLVWIHGGGLVWGFGEQSGYHPDNQLTASLNVVSVNINYRVGLLGFLSLEELWDTSTDSSYANYGIMDQILALKWVKENIKTFGGDPSKVTIFGESGGGSAVYSLIGSNPARGLFSQAIAASGGPSITTTYQQSNEHCRNFINKTGCYRNTSAERKQCLKNLDADIIINYTDFSQGLFTFPWFFPFNKPNVGLPMEVIDPVTIQNGPGNLPSDVGNKLNVLVTNTAQEIPWFSSIKSWEQLKNILQNRTDSFIPNIYQEMLTMYQSGKDKMKPVKISPDYIYETMTTDVRVSCTTNDVAKNLSAIPNYQVYRGVFSQPPSTSLGRGMTNAFHGWDCYLLFGSIKNLRSVTEDEKALQKNIRHIYKSFLHFEKSFSSEYKDKTFVFWNNTVLTLTEDYHKAECETWKKYGLLKNAWGRRG